MDLSQFHGHKNANQRMKKNVGDGDTRCERVRVKPNKINLYIAV